MRNADELAVLLVFGDCSRKSGAQANTSFIDIRGLQVGSGKATRFPIAELYITLTTTGMPRAEMREVVPGEDVDISASESQFMAERGSGRVELHEMLQHRRLVIVGDPG